MPGSRAGSGTGWVSVSALEGATPAIVLVGAARTCAALRGSSRGTRRHGRRNVERTLDESPYGRRFEGRVAIVTGASRGIGLGIARRIVAEGGRVTVTARGAEALAAAAAE